MDNSINNPILLTSPYYINLYAYYYRSKKEFYMKPHTHNRIEFMYVTQGHCSITIKNNIFNLSKGQMVFIDANVLHNLHIPKQESCRMLNLEFTFTTKENIMPSTLSFLKEVDGFNNFINSQSTYIMLSDSGILMENIRKIITEMEYFKNELKVQLLIYQFFTDFFSFYKEALLNNNVDAYVNKAINYILNHYDYDLRAQDIANNVGLHPNYLHRIFKKQVGQSLMEYLNIVRLNRSKKLLVSKNYSIQEISELVGYNSRQYFTSKFQNTFGITPGEYRKTKVPWHQT